MRRLPIIIAVCLLAQHIAPTLASAAEFFAQFNCNGKKLGNFLVYDQDKDVMLSADAMRALKVPVVDDIPITTLNQYGEMTWDQAEQMLTLRSKIVCISTGTSPASSSTAPLIPSKKWDLKSFDYQVFGGLGNQGGSYQASGTGTGKVFGLDVDLSLYTNSRASGTINWHDEDNSYVKDVKVGSVPISGIDRGIGLTNESNTRYQSSFGTEQVVVNYPVGTKIDIYQGTAFIASQTTNTPQFIINLPLTYGTSSFLLRAFLPTGEVKEETITRDVNSYLTQFGKFTYNLSGGWNKSDTMVSSGRVNYGLMNNLSVYADADTEQAGAGIYFSPVDSWVLNGHYSTKNWTGSSFYNNQTYGAFSINYNETDTVATTTSILAPKLPFNPVIVYTGTTVRDSSTKTVSARNSFSLFNLYVSPRFEYTRNSSKGSPNNDRWAAGAQVIWNAPKEITVRADGLYNSSPNSSYSTFDVDIEKRWFGMGSTTMKNHIISQDGKTQLTSTDLDMQLYNFKYMGVTAGFSHNWQTSDNSATVSLTGSITRVGASSSPQANTATINIRTYLDKSNTGHYVPGVDELIPALIKIDGRDMENNTGNYVAWSMTPYIPYLISVEPDLDSEPTSFDYKIIPTRGELAQVDIPYKAIKEIEGRVSSKKSNQLVEIALKDGSVKKLYSGFDGYWSTRLRADLVPDVVVVKDSSAPAAGSVVAKAGGVGVPAVDAKALTGKAGEVKAPAVVGAVGKVAGKEKATSKDTVGAVVGESKALPGKAATAGDVKAGAVDAKAVAGKVPGAGEVKAVDTKAPVVDAKAVTGKIGDVKTPAAGAIGASSEKKDLSVELPVEAPKKKVSSRSAGTAKKKDGVLTNGDVWATLAALASVDYEIDPLFYTGGLIKQEAKPFLFTSEYPKIFPKF